MQVKSVSLLWLGSLASSGCIFLAQLFVARIYGPALYGQFSSAVALVTLLVPLAGFGIAPFWLRVFGVEGWSGERWWSGSIKFSLISTVLAFVFIWFCAFVFRDDVTYSTLLLLISFYILGQVILELVGATLQLEERFESLALWNLVPGLLRLILIVAGVLFLDVRDKIVYPAFVFSIVSIVLFIFGAWRLRKVLSGHFSLVGHGEKKEVVDAVKPSWVEVGKQAWPYGAGGLFYLLYFQTAVIFIHHLAGSLQAGIFNAAFVFMVAVYILPAVIFQKYLMPRIHRWAASDKSALANGFHSGNKAMLLAGLIFGVVLWFGADILIDGIYGEKYSAAIPVLKIMALGIPLRFVATSAGSVLATGEQMRRKVRYMMLVATVSIVSNFIVVPEYGAMGAAVVAVISDAILLFCYYFAANRYVFVGLKNE